jgi:uncharacterized protein YqgV (UPF0045/DUF77 family)
MSIDPERTVNVSIQVLPLCDDPLPVIDRAIAAILQSGVRHEVGPMETTMEGDLDQLLDLARRAHLAALAACDRPVVSIIKIGDSPQGTSMERKVAKYR